MCATRSDSGYTLQDFQRLLAESGIHLNEEQAGRLYNFHHFLRDENEALNLTRIHSFETAVRKHYVDSIIVLSLLREAGIAFPARLLDLGSGAGFPGIPLAIADPALHVILNDGRKIRTDFMERACRKIGLTNVSFLTKKIHSTFQYDAEAVITRAVDAMPETVSRIARTLRTGGLLFFMKGPNCDEEIRDVKELPGEPCELLLDRSYVLPGSDDQRRLVVWRYTPSEAFLSSLPGSESEDRSGVEELRLLLSSLPSGDTPGGGAAYASLDSREQSDGYTGDSSKNAKRASSWSPRITEIASAENPKFRSMQGLDSSRSIKKQGKTILHGKRIVSEFLSDSGKLTGESAAGIPRPEALVYDASRELPPAEQLSDLLDLSPPDAQEMIGSTIRALPHWIVAHSLFRELDQSGTGGPLLLLSLPEIPAWDEGSFGGDRVLFLPIGNPENLGAALRSAVAFGFFDVVLLAEAAHPYLPSVIRASAGELFHLRLYRGPSVKELHTKLPLFALDSEGEEISSVELPARVGLLVGQEGQGLPHGMEGRRIRIPVENAVESLNASVAVGIALYVIHSQLRKM